MQFLSIEDKSKMTIERSMPCKFSIPVFMAGDVLYFESSSLEVISEKVITDIDML
jgi:hypothetical protein